MIHGLLCRTAHADYVLVVPILECYFAATSRVYMIWVSWGISIQPNLGQHRVGALLLHLWTWVLPLEVWQTFLPIRLLTLVLTASVSVSMRELLLDLNLYFAGLWQMEGDRHLLFAILYFNPHYIYTALDLRWGYTRRGVKTVFCCCSQTSSD